MPDSSNEKNVQQNTERAIKFALKVPAGHLSSKTPIALAVQSLLKNKDKENVKKSGLDLNGLSPANLCGELFAINKDWVNWLPETIWKEFPCNDVIKNKIRAIQTLLLKPDTQFDVDVFTHIIHAFNNDISNWSVLTPIPCEEIVYGVDQMRKVHEFDLWPEVTAFIKACMVNDGIIWLPWLDLEEKNGLEYNTKNLKLVWDKVKDNSVEMNLENVLHVQIAKLYDIQSYLKAMA